MKPQDKTSTTRLQAKSRQREAIALRMSGATISQICERLQCGRATAHRYISKALTELAEEVRGDTTRVRDLELARLDRMLLGVWGNAVKGDVQSVDRAVKIMERRAKLLGLDAPTKLAHGGDPEAPPIKTEQAQSLTDADLERIASSGGA